MVLARHAVGMVDLIDQIRDEIHEARNSGYEVDGVRLTREDIQQLRDKVTVYQNINPDETPSVFGVKIKQDESVDSPKVIRRR